MMSLPLMQIIQVQKSVWLVTKYHSYYEDEQLTVQLFVFLALGTLEMEWNC